jgi:hypothetical protein
LPSFIVAFESLRQQYRWWLRLSKPPSTTYIVAFENLRQQYHGG